MVQPTLGSQIVLVNGGFVVPHDVHMREASKPLTAAGIVERASEEGAEVVIDKALLAMLITQ